MRTRNSNRTLDIRGNRQDRFDARGRDAHYAGHVGSLFLCAAATGFKRLVAAVADIGRGATDAVAECMALGGSITVAAVAAVVRGEPMQRYRRCWLPVTSRPLPVTRKSRSA